MKPKGIVLSTGEIIVVDDIFHNHLNKFSWYILNADTIPYARKTKQSPYELMHITIAKDILGIEINDKQVIDHIDGNGLNNQINNLRIVSQSLNSHNRKVNKNSFTGIPGILFHRRDKKYSASLMINYARINLGYFNTKEEAQLARENFKKRLIERQYKNHPPLMFLEYYKQRENEINLKIT